MSKKKVFIGIAFVLIGIWFYIALSTFSIDETSFPKKLIIQEGTVRTADEVAEALSKEMGFDLEGAFKSGYNSREVVNYLIQEPHKLDITMHDGNFYQERKTVPHIIPLSISIILIVFGTVMTLFGFKTKKT